MSAYVDDMRAQFGRMIMCHLIADTDAELHAMADAIGVARRWHQKPPKASHSHYDIALSKRAAAIAAGAVPITQRQAAMMCRRRAVTGSLGTPETAEAWFNAYLYEYRKGPVMTEATKPTAESIALMLTGREYPLEIPKDILAQAKAAGMVIVYGHSDDLMEFAGAIDDEIGVDGGGTAHLDRRGVLDREQCESDEEIADYTIRKRTSQKIEALWCAEGDYSWTYATDLPHATFEVVEDGEPYCRGIVFALADLPEAQRAGAPA